MKVACKVLIGLAVMQASLFAQTPTQTPGPEIEVVDGKVTMSALAVPLGRLVSMLDRATGLTSQVKPELANRPISVRFTGLPLKDAVHKIFEGQPLNYMLIEGKGIRVTEAAIGVASSATTPPFPDSGPITQTPLPNITPLQPGAPITVNAPVQPAQTPFPGTGTVANPNAPQANPASNSNPPGAVAPGQIPPPIGASSNPLNPISAPAPITGFPTTPAPAPQPTGPGTLGGTPAPGTIR